MSARTVLRRLAPWLAGLAILAIIITRVPFAAFRDAIGKGPHLRLFAVDLAITLVVLGTDSVSTWIGLVAVRMRRRFTDVFFVRGATYVLFLVNYALGQGGFGYYLYRTGETALRATGATLFLIGTNLATLLVVTSLAWAASELPVPGAMWWTLVVGCAGFAAYLVAIAVAPGVLARRHVLAPLFEAGLGGHALAMVGRLPHVAVITLGHWAALRAWGVPAPLVSGLTIMPAVVIASVLPISVGGLGTTQAALVFFFADYAIATTAGEREAFVLAFAIAHFVYLVIARRWSASRACRSRASSAC